MSDWYVLIDEKFLTQERFEKELNMMLPLVLFRSFGLENRSQIPNYKEF